MSEIHQRLFCALFTAAAILIATAVAIAESATITGTAHVIDADTVRVGHARIRLFGIDAPEATQSCTKAGESYPCGAVATAFARQLVHGRRVECVSDDLDRHRRIVATCWTVGGDGRREGETINARMVAAGHAVAYRKYSDKFVDAEAKAREARRGMWSGEFQQPAEHRAAARGK